MDKAYTPQKGEISEAYMAFMLTADNKYQIIGPDGRGEPMDELPDKIKLKGRIMTRFYVRPPVQSNPVGIVGYE